MWRIHELVVPSRTNGSSFREEELAVTTGWTHAGKDGATMPGKGKLIVRDYTELELESIRQGVERLTLSLGKALECLGSRTVDAFLNGVAYWRNIPENVWKFTIGGYQVMKKWLNYREKDLLDRPLKTDEVRFVQSMVRRLMVL